MDENSLQTSAGKSESNLRLKIYSPYEAPFKGKIDFMFKTGEWSVLTVASDKTGTGYRLVTT